MSENSHSRVAIAYIPVLHRGYLNFLESAIAQGATTLFLVGDDILASHEELDYMNRKDRVRALSVEDMARAVGEVVHIETEVLTRERAHSLAKEIIHLIMPDEDVSRVIAGNYFSDAQISYVSIFLRWHRDNTAEQKEIESFRSIDVTELDRTFMERALEESSQSFDWWRQIGAALVKDGQVVLASHNTHMPDEQSANIFGDPRAVTKKGIDITISTAAHAEEVVIGEAARRGIATEGASIYVTDFPCPYCARLIAHAGIKTCYFARGYSVLDGGELLKNAGAELIFVDMKKERQ